MKKNYDFSKGKRGAVDSKPHKMRISIRFDPDVIKWFKDQVEEAGGGNYQTLMNQALREHIANYGTSDQNKRMIEVIRKMLREELKRKGVANEHTNSLNPTNSGGLNKARR